jgi:hypothetical protein
MSSRYAIHPMEKKFHDDMAAKVKMDALIEECWSATVLEGHTDTKSFFRRGFVNGAYHMNPKKPKPISFEEWLDRPVHPDTEFKNRHFIPQDQFPTCKRLFEQLMSEFV